ncbi:MAG TPA: DUF3078 domain-containing protein [Flavobacteriales bacterium]|nr:DUF3078 domain-containing protein [Flavobacteriales bacterium]
MFRNLTMLFALAIVPQVVAQNDIDTTSRSASTKAMLARSAADTTGKLWTKSGVFNINMTQVSLTNWSAGGFSSVSGIAMFNGIANWKKDRRAWDNSLVLAFGGQHVHDGTEPRKTDDRIELNSKYGYELNKAIYLAALFQFKTQFTEGFNADDIRISNFLSPSYTLLGLGLDYKPDDKLSVFFSPATARLVTVMDETLFYGSTDPELRIYGVKNGSTSELELGGYFRLQYTTTLAENITFMTRGDVFSNYLRNPQNMDVTWETLWTFKVNEWFAATLNTLLLYDHDTQLPKTDAEGIPYLGPDTQFKETLGVGLSFKL